MDLYINACVREDSRTHRLAEALIGKLGADFEELKLTDMRLCPLDGDTLAKRTALLQAGRYDDPMFRLARQFAEADRIVIAAPYWDGSFPAVLKTYLENIYVIGIVSRYNREGVPVGLCRAAELWYVTTAGGQYFPDFSYDYVAALAAKCFGIPMTHLIKAEGLDVDGNDAESILRRAIDSL